MIRDDGLSINVRLRSDQLAALDRWIEGLSGARLSRPEAIRRLLELGLSHASPEGRLSHEARTHASALAGEVVDQLTDSAAPVEEQQKRKRRLIHGPREFRELRKDQHLGKNAEPSGGTKGKR
jgi:Arc/MetJ-type ribon-helix-helix transcriptional regulator